MSGLSDDWQSTKTTWDEKLLHILSNGIRTDIVFLVGEEGKRFAAHKLILACRSNVFDEMFYGPLAEKKDEIRVEDEHPEAFDCLLKFLYANKSEVKTEFAVVTLYSAKKYNIKKLEEECVKQLKNKLSLENVLTILPQAMLFDEEALIETCLTKIDENTKAVFMSDEFTEISNATLCFLLKRDNLNASELEIFRAVQNWSKKECDRNGLQTSGEQLRKVMGDAMKLIRFPLISATDLATFVIPIGILTESEGFTLFMYHASNQETDPIFSAKERKYRASVPLSVCRFPNLFNSTYNWGTKYNMIDFKVGQPIKLVGFGIYRTCSPWTGNVSITVLSGQSRVGDFMQEMSFDAVTEINRIILPAPVTISADTWYTISFMMPATTVFGDNGKSSVSCESVKFEFRNPPPPSAGCCVKFGQVPEIVFSKI